jgi:hypothetical protein
MTRVTKLKIALLLTAFSSFSIFSNMALSAPGAASHGGPPAGALPSAATSAVKSAAIKTQADADQPMLAAPGADAGNVAGTAQPAPPPEDPTIYGLAMPIVIDPDNPPRTHVYSGMIWYQPPKWRWNNLQVYVSGRFGHWWADGAPVFRALNIYSVAPVLRYYFVKKKYFSPFVELSVGPGYLTRTQFGNRNLGMHFTFQDELGIGVVAGREAGPYATISILHYSNAHLSAHNSGITVPVMLTLGYQFN